MLCPVLTPAELWQQTGRYEIPEVFKVEDRAGRPFVLPMTHEETFTFHAREIQSYRELPQILYHFATKDRDEPRPRGGLIRVREFIMKDSYSFDRDEEGLDASFQLHAGAYGRIFERCGLEVYAVQAEPGMMGGSESIDYLAPAGAGENTLVTCERGDYAADLEIALGIPRAPEFPTRLDAPEEVATPGITTIEALADVLGIDPAATSKAMPVVKADGTLVLGLIRGDDRLEEAKLASVLGSAIRPATEDEIRSAFGAEAGSLGPIGFSGQIVADDALREGQFVAGANRTGWHLRGVAAGRDFEPEFADIRVSPRRATAARAAAAGSAFRPRSRSGISSSSARGIPSLSARCTPTRAGRNGRSSWGATASGPGASWLPRSSSDTTTTASPGRVPSLPTMSTSWRSAQPVPRRSTWRTGCRTCSRAPASPCSSTSATGGRERSSPTPI